MIFSSDVEHREVAVVVVTSGNHLLIGKRNDSGKWAIPGGHLNDGETPQAAAMREMREESGIDAKHLQYIRSYKLRDKDEKRLTVHIFHTELSDQVPGDVSEDPDEEIKKWQWVDISKGLPDEIADNLHRDLDLGLVAMGIL